MIGCEKETCLVVVSDENECEKVINGIISNGGCQHRCNNTIGSYTCSCNDGYLLTDDNITCEGKMFKNLILHNNFLLDYQEEHLS